MSFFKLDLHTHILPMEWPDLKEKYGYGGFVSLQHDELKQKAKMVVDGKFFREIECNCWCAETRKKQSEACGVNVQVLSTVPIMFSYWAKPDDCLDLSMYLNNHIAQVVSENPKKFIGLGTLPMQSPELAITELRRCVNDLGLAGVQIGSHINDWNLDEPALFPIFEEAEKLGACIFVHPWDMMGKDSMPKYFMPWLVGMPAETCRAICSLIFGGVLDRLPKLKIAFAHGGGSFAGTLGRIDHGFYARPDLCQVNTKKSPKEYIGQIWVDSLVHDKTALKQIVDLFGADKVMLGSDYPFPLGEDHPGELVENHNELDDATKQKILADNAFDFLGLNKENFL
eukprot:TRINITY_DN180_c1_g1_i2.p1 TRINITY_DN180_c1_g1~~TRINITY_DN180_c1_g1_i2.p1  ORF type:complete len:341 (+),score=148.02 TRINITY_DN180_c1_g1_i2:731-1753(+)